MRYGAESCTIVHVQIPNPDLTDEQREAQTRADLDWWLSDQRGRRLARTLVRWSGIDDTGPLNGIEQMAEATGRRQIGNLLKAQIRKHVPELWILLETEHVQELVHIARVTEQRRRAADTDTPV